MRSKTMKIIVAAIVALTAAQIATAQLPKETEAQKAQRMKWWTDARFGMFIHWGLYALPARHEWVKNRERMTNEQYQKYFELFNPDLYNPREWARMAKAAGMKYAVLTSKHHEGFCLWDSKYTDYKATNTPCGKDLIKEYVEALRAECLKVGFYYSLIDWHHPDYTVDRVHPERQETDADYEKLNAGRDMNKYREYIKNQVRELPCSAAYNSADRCLDAAGEVRPVRARTSSNVSGRPASRRIEVTEVGGREAPAGGVFGSADFLCLLLFLRDFIDSYRLLTP